MAAHDKNAKLVTKLMQDIDIAMFTTVGANGYLVSRPLSTQQVEFDGERLWFFTEADSPKVAEMRKHPKVNVGYASKGKNTYLSVAGDASLNRDRGKIEELWSDALKAFFPKGVNDRNLALIEVRVRTIEYWEGPGSLIGKAITFLVARVTGNDDVLGENKIVTMKHSATGRRASAKKPTGKAMPPAKKSTARKQPARKGVAGKSVAKKATARKKTAKRARS